MKEQEIKRLVKIVERAISVPWKYRGGVAALKSLKIQWTPTR